MYNILLTAHNLLRWVVLISLLYSVAIAVYGYCKKAVFTSTNNHIRHWTATLCHIQLTIGIILYTQSPLVKYYFSADDKPNGDGLFFSLIHIIMMLVAIILITIGSAKAKREIEDHNKYKTLMYWFTAGLILILIAIPWPFSPLSSRPLIRL